MSKVIAVTHASDMDHNRYRTDRHLNSKNEYATFKDGAVLIWDGDPNNWQSQAEIKMIYGPGHWSQVVIEDA